MRILLISFFLLFPSLVFGGMGDIYYCQSNKNIDIENGKVTTYKDERFKFKRTSEGLIFGCEKCFLQGETLTFKNFDVGSELFSYRDNDDRTGQSTVIFKYDEGNFNYSFVSYESVTSVTGTCSIF